MSVWKIALGVFLGIAATGVVAVVAIYGLGSLASTDDKQDACIAQHEDYAAGIRSDVDEACR